MVGAMEAPVTTSVHALRTAHEQFVTMPGASPRVRDLVGDTDGTLLWVEGDAATIGRGEGMHFAEGVVWSEARAGTNAPGTALELGRPVQIVTGEPYSSAVHAWSCAAAPNCAPRSRPTARTR